MTRASESAFPLLSGARDVTGAVRGCASRQTRGSAVMSAPFRMPHFRYTGDAKILSCIDVDLHAELYIVGDPEMGGYEWVLVNHGDVEKHSDCGYGQRSIALRDGLIEYHGLPA